MEDKIANLLEYIVTALEDGKISVHINAGDYMSEEYHQDVGTIPMLVCHVDDYLEENHDKLTKEMLSPLAMALNGDIAIRTTSKGLRYYKENKKELYDNIHLKCGAQRVYVYDADRDECWIQSNSEHLIKNVGQIPDFGSSPMESKPVQEEYQDDLMDRPLLTIEEMIEGLPEQLTGIKLYAADMVEIVKIIQHRLTMEACESIENLINERET